MLRLRCPVLSYTRTEHDKSYNKSYTLFKTDVTVQIFYSRDGSDLNDGNMVPKTVNANGYINIKSADSYISQTMQKLKYMIQTINY